MAELFIQLQGIERTMSESILAEAEKLINGEKRDEYGPVQDSFKRVALYWEAYLFPNRQTFTNICPGDVAIMMILFKIAREQGSHKRDNLVDIAGYVGCLDKLYATDSSDKEFPSDVSGCNRDGKPLD